MDMLNGADRYFVRNNGYYKKKKKQSKMFGRGQVKGVIIRVRKINLSLMSTL